MQTNNAIPDQKNNEPRYFKILRLYPARTAGGDGDHWALERKTFDLAGYTTQGATTDANGWKTGNRYFVADVNGDGKADIVLRDANGMLATWLSNGKTFDLAGYTTQGATTDVNGWNTGNRYFVGDVNGDGKADFILRDANGMLATWVMLSGHSNLMASCTTGLGNTTLLTYKPITDGTVYTKEANAAYPTVDIQAPLYVVSQSTVPDGIGGTRNTNYFYSGAKGHMLGGGFLGFHKYDVTDGSTLIKTSTTFRQDYPLQGLPTSVVQTQSNGNVLHSVSNTWGVTTYGDTALPLGTANGNGTATPPTSKHHFPAITQAVETTNELNNSLVTQLTSNTSYDTYGNATSVTTATNDGFSKTITNTYAPPNLTNWIIGRLINSTVQSTSP